MTAVEAEWAAALVDAGIAGAAAKLYTLPPCSAVGGGRQAAYSAPGEFVLPPPEQAFLEVLNGEPDLHYRNARRAARPRSCLKSERGAHGDHRSMARVHGVDDFGVVDALEVDRGDAEVAVAQLTLHDD